MARTRPNGHLHGLIVLGVLASLLLTAAPSSATAPVAAASSMSVARTTTLYNESTLSGDVGLAQPSGPVRVEWNATLNRTYYSDYGGDFLILDSTSGRVLASANLSSHIEGFAVDAVDDRAFVALPSLDELAVLNATSAKLLALVPVGLSPVGVAFDPTNGMVYVANSGGSNLTVVIAHSHRTAGSVPAGPGPEWLTVDPVLGRAFVADWGANCTSGPAPNICYLAEVDLTNGTLLDRLVTPRVAQLTFDGANGLVYAPEPSNGSVGIFSATSLAQVGGVRTGPVGGGEYPYSATVDGYDGNIYVADQAGGNFTVVSGSSGRMVYSTPKNVSLNVRSITYDGVTNAIEGVTTTYIGLAAFDPSTLAETAIAPLMAQPDAVAYDPVNGEVYVADAAFCIVYGINASNSRVTQTFGVPGGSCEVSQMAVNTTDGNVYTTTSLGPTIINASTGAVSHLKVYNSPTKYLYDPVSGDVYCASPSVIQVIDPANDSRVATIDTQPWQITGLTLDSQNGRIYAAMWRQPLSGKFSQVMSIDASTAALAGNLTVPQSVPGQTGLVTVDPTAGLLFVEKFRSTNRLVVLVIGNGTMVKNLALSGSFETYGLAFDTRNGELYLANYVLLNGGLSDGTEIQSIRVATLRSNGEFTVSTLGGASGLAFDSASGRLFAADYSGQVFAVVA